MREGWAAQIDRAIAHLCAVDARLALVIDRIGRCWLEPAGAGFGALVSAIISQQISTRAARAIKVRLAERLGGEPTPARILAADTELLRSAGLSAAKVRYLRDLAERTASGALDLDRMLHEPDEAVITELVQIKGIGRWTAEMYLIFSLGRLDVLPVDDYGLRAGIRKLYALDTLPGRAELEALTTAWRPYRSIGTWYIWRSLENGL
jgi:DNA-3-methyladenine glycosylase II